MKIVLVANKLKCIFGKGIMVVSTKSTTNLMHEVATGKKKKENLKQGKKMMLLKVEFNAIHVVDLNIYKLSVPTHSKRKKSPLHFLERR